MPSQKLYAFFNCVLLLPRSNLLTSLSNSTRAAHYSSVCPGGVSFPPAHSLLGSCSPVLGDSSCLHLGLLHLLHNSVERFPRWLLSPVPFFLHNESYCSSPLSLFDHSRWFHHTWSPLLPKLQRLSLLRVYQLSLVAVIMAKMIAFLHGWVQLERIWQEGLVWY